MITLGIYSLGLDPSAAIVQDGQTLAFFEEERLVRLKHANNIFPMKSIAEVLKESNLQWEMIDSIAVPWDASKYDDGRMANHYQQINEVYSITHKNDLAYEQKKIKEFKSEKLRSGILRHLRKHFGNLDFPDIHFVSHHHAHACTAYFNSGLKSSMVMVLDGSGEEVTISIWEGRDTTIHLIKEIKTPISLGWFYSAVTEYLGFNAYGDEWQVMGLSSFGEKKENYNIALEKFEKVIWYDGYGDVNANPHLISLGEKSFSEFCSDSFVELMGYPVRSSSEELTQWHKDISRAAQDHLEKIVQKLVEFWSKSLNNRNLCLAGGVALNVKMNGNLFETDLVDTVYVYPIASDCGTSVGAAMAHQLNVNGTLVNRPIKNVYLGNAFSDIEIERTLLACKLPFTKPQDLAAFVAKNLTENKIIGWFQGRMEGGQRALGARSILADARYKDSKVLVNKIIKYREIWRPFGPSMLKEAAIDYFKESKKIKANLSIQSLSFMTLALSANEKARREIPAVIHIDGTSRIHVVKDGTNQRYYDLLIALRDLTGIGVVLNTSFNVKGEPIVCTPMDAIRTFYGTGLDLLVIGNCVLNKAKIN